jgi:hypothetical protein
MTATIVVLLIGYIVAVIGLFRKERDGISVMLALLLAAGLVAGIVKERGDVRSAADRARVDAQRQAFEDEERKEGKQREAERDAQLASILQRIEIVSRETANPQTRQRIDALQQDITKTASEVKVVSIHVGDDDSKSGVFKYDAPPGYRIVDFKLRERSKGGDAHYAVASQTPTHVEVNWSVKSRTIRGPFHMVVNTITAFLTLDADVELQPENSASSG